MSRTSRISDWTRRLTAILALALPGVAAAQVPTVTLRGFAWDSIASRPLVGAFISLNTARSTQSDSTGAFTFDSVALGIHELELHHAVLDTMGLSGISTRIALLDATYGALIAIPSFPTLWAAACGARPAPTDSGFVFGTVRRARDEEGVAGATVKLGWIDLTLINVREFRQKRYTAEMETDEFGEYAICGVPLDSGLEIAASQGNEASAPTSVGTTFRVRRRDLMIGPIDSAVAPRGSVVGVVTHIDGRPFEGATVVLDAAEPQRTEKDGKFAFAGVLTGTRQLEVLAIGSRPQVVTVDVRPGEPASVLVRMDRLTTLDAVRIIGTRWQIKTLEELALRMGEGKGQFRDSTQLGNRHLLGAVFSGFRGLEMRYSRGGDVGTLEMPGRGATRRCRPTLWIDGYREYELTWLNLLKPDEIAVMEVYERPELVPFRFAAPTNPDCGAIVIWTKGVMP